MTRARLLHMAVIAALITAVGTFGPWLQEPTEITTIPFSPFKFLPTVIEVPYAGGWWVRAAAVLALVLLLADSERQWALVLALLLQGVVGTVALCFLATAARDLVEPNWGLWVTGFGVLASNVALFGRSCVRCPSPRPSRRRPAMTKACRD